jgi:hypothetical protein
MSNKLPEAFPKNPENFVFLENEVLDSLVSTVMELSAQLWTAKRRTLITERILEAKGLVSRAEIETFVANPEDEAAWRAERDRYIKQVYEPFARKIPTEKPPAPASFLKR